VPKFEFEEIKIELILYAEEIVRRATIPKKQFQIFAGFSKEIQLISEVCLVNGTKK